MFGWPKAKTPTYPIGTIIKFRRGKNNDLTDRYVLGMVVSCEATRKEWGDLMGVQIHGSSHIHHIWSNNTKFMEMSDGEKCCCNLRTHNGASI